MWIHAGQSKFHGVVICGIWSLILTGVKESEHKKSYNGTSLFSDLFMQNLNHTLSLTRRPLQKGLTLIEIMVVVVIMGILATLVVPKLMGRPDEARKVAAKQDIASIMQALNLYHLDNGRYPTTEQGLDALVKAPTTEPVPSNYKEGGYLSKLPKDPWGNKYQYLSPGLKGEVDVMSLGADGKPGGEGVNADIGSWQL